MWSEQLLHLVNRRSAPTMKHRLWHADSWSHGAPLGFRHQDSDSWSLGRRTISRSTTKIVEIWSRTPSAETRWVCELIPKQAGDACNHRGGSAQDTAQLQRSSADTVIRSEAVIQKLKACAEILVQEDYKRSGHDQQDFLVQTPLS